MTRSDIIQAIRNLVVEQESDAGGLLDDSGNMLEFVSDAQEQVMMDLIPFMPGQFLFVEDRTLVANTPSYTITSDYWQVYKVERNETGKAPKELEVVDPLEFQFHTNVGDTEERPDACYFIGDTFYPLQIPSAAQASWVRLYLVRPELETMEEDGPSYIPRPAHRMIVYLGAAMVAMLLRSDPTPFMAFYAKRYKAVKSVWAGRFQQKPRFVRPSVRDRLSFDDREKAFTDPYWR